MIYHILHDFRILYLITYVESLVFTNKFTELVDGFYFLHNFMINTLDNQIKYHMNISSEISGKPRTSPLILQNKSTGTSGSFTWVSKLNPVRNPKIWLLGRRRYWSLCEHTFCGINYPLHDEIVCCIGSVFLVMRRSSGRLSRFLSGFLYILLGRLVCVLRQTYRHSSWQIPHLFFADLPVLAFLHTWLSSSTTRKIGFNNGQITLSYR